MNKKILIAIIISAAIITATGIFTVEQIAFTPKNETIIFNNTIEGVGTFNSINATNFTLTEEADSQTFYGSNLTGCEVSVITSASMVDTTIQRAEKTNDSAGGHTIYKNTANLGDHVGEVRYFGIIEDKENSRFIMISTPDFNITSKIVDTFKVLQPLHKETSNNAKETSQPSTSSYAESSNTIMVKREDGQGYMEIDRSQAEYSDGVWHQSKA